MRTVPTRTKVKSRKSKKRKQLRRGGENGEGERVSFQEEAVSPPLPGRSLGVGWSPTSPPLLNRFFLLCTSVAQKTLQQMRSHTTQMRMACEQECEHKKTEAATTKGKVERTVRWGEKQLFLLKRKHPHLPNLSTSPSPFSFACTSHLNAMSHSMCRAT